MLWYSKEYESMHPRAIAENRIAVSPDLDNMSAACQPLTSGIML
jgi:hypothetical protein